MGKATYRYSEIQPWPAEETHGNEEVLDEWAVKNVRFIMGRVVAVSCDMDGGSILVSSPER